jgi:hypothetical protein
MPALQTCVPRLADIMDWSKRTDPASRQQLNDLLAFYQRAQFNFDQKSKTLTRIL